MSEMSVDVQHGLRKALKANQVVFDALGGGPKTTHAEVACLLYLAANPDALQQDAAEAVGVSQQAVSRWMLDWSTKREGLGFLTLERDPDNLRKVNYSWTPKGRRLLQSVWDTMKG